MAGGAAVHLKGMRAERLAFFNSSLAGRNKKDRGIFEFRTHLEECRTPERGHVKQ